MQVHQIRNHSGTRSSNVCTFHTSADFHSCSVLAFPPVTSHLVLSISFPVFLYYCHKTFPSYSSRHHVASDFAFGAHSWKPDHILS
ncbi:hypothetical protein L211DRAFT_520251 [Terfezia boudieri ATCC MYA-4762]|uniref:Uncharacterized protein n=1 Tax=Terfezia boudieri ATCC MYA-4762 TaxID=1051890 RepID=A0A3N4LC54_9PEZI|nr:hypothetical protein L211DRAFT_520251 [Terfezia boudieri ATCC MYA-4762]